MYNHDNDVFHCDYMALKLPETMFSVEDMLELYVKCFDCYNEVESCCTLPKLQSLRRRNLNIFSAVRENMRAMELVDGPVLQRMWIAQHCQSLEIACLRLNMKIKDKIVWSIKTNGSNQKQQEKKMSQMTKFEEEYQQHVLQWAHDRNIINGSDNIKQLLKTLTEAGEFIDAIMSEDVDEYVDAIGDQWVTIVIGMEQSGVPYQEALDASRKINSPPLTDDIISAISLIADGILKQEKSKLSQGYGEYLSVLRAMPDFFDGVVKAWNTIKDRKGKMVNGVFVKEQDLV